MNWELILEIGGTVLGVGALNILGVYFVFTKQFQEYIERAVGKSPQVDAKVTHAVRMATFEEVEQVRNALNTHISDVNSRLQVMARDAVEGRRNLHKDIEKCEQNINERLMELTNSVGELRGELRRIA